MRWSPLFGQFETSFKLLFAPSDQFPVDVYLSNKPRLASSHYERCVGGCDYKTLSIC